MIIHAVLYKLYFPDFSPWRQKSFPYTIRQRLQPSQLFIVGFFRVRRHLEVKGESFVAKSWQEQPRMDLPLLFCLPTPPSYVLFSSSFSSSCSSFLLPPSFVRFNFFIIICPKGEWSSSPRYPQLNEWMSLRETISYLLSLPSRSKKPARWLRGKRRKWKLSPNVSHNYLPYEIEPVVDVMMHKVWLVLWCSKCRDINFPRVLD